MSAPLTTIFAVSTAVFALTCTAFAQAPTSEPSSSKAAPAMPPSQNDPSSPQGTAPGHEVQGSVKMASVHFVEPKDKATVPQKTTVKFAVEGLKVAKAGEPTPGTGHFTLIIDQPAVKEGEAVPMDAQHIHYGKGQMQDMIALKPGAHTLTLQLVDGAHHAYGPLLTQTIHITAK